MDLIRIAQEQKPLVFDLARFNLAKCIYENLAHHSIPDSQRWNIDSWIAHRHMFVDPMVLGTWSVRFVGVMAYTDHWNLTSEIIRQGLRPDEVKGINTGQYVIGLNDDNYYNALRNNSLDEKMSLFAIVNGKDVWDGYARPLINNILPSEGFYKRNNS